MINQDIIDQIRLSQEKIDEKWEKHLETCQTCLNWERLGVFETYGLKCAEGYINREKFVLYLLIMDKTEHFIQ